MYGGKQFAAVFAGIGQAVFERVEHVVRAGHGNAEALFFQLPSQLERHIQRDVFFQMAVFAQSADGAGVFAAVPGVDDDIGRLCAAQMQDTGSSGSRMGQPFDRTERRTLWRLCGLKHFKSLKGCGREARYGRGVAETPLCGGSKR